MPYEGSPVIDADAHVVETERTWDFLRTNDAHFKPVLFTSPESQLFQYWFVQGEQIGLRERKFTDEQLQQMSEQTGYDLYAPQAARQLDDVKLRLNHMDELGIDVQVMHNTLWLLHVSDRPDVEVALSRAYNRWLADIWRQGEGRLRWACVLPTLDMTEALEELRFSRSNGAVAVGLQALTHGRSIVDPYFYPIYAEAEKLGMAIAVHISNGSPEAFDIWMSPYDRGAFFLPLRMPTVAACYAQVTGELPHLFPKLRWAYVEATAQWIPWLTQEARQRAKRQGRSAPDDPLREANVWVSCQTDDDFHDILRYTSKETLVLGTDYGHADSSAEMDATLVFRNMDILDPETKKMVLGTNAETLYGI